MSSSTKLKKRRGGVTNLHYHLPPTRVESIILVVDLPNKVVHGVAILEAD